MAAFSRAEKLLAEFVDALVFPPAYDLAAQFRRCRTLRRAQFGVDFLKSRPHGRQIAAVAVDEQEPLEAMFRQRRDIVADDQHQGRGPERHRAGKFHVVRRHADTDGRPDETAGRLADTQRDFLGADRIGADQPVGAVLLGGADRQDDAARRLQIVFDLGPGAKLKAHRLSGSLRSDCFRRPSGLT